MAALALVVAIASTLGVVGMSAPAGACSSLGLTTDFEGTVIAVAGHDVTYRVDRVHWDKAIGRPRLEPGATTVVTYDSTRDLLVPHHRYRVVGWASSSGQVESQIAHEFHGDCGTGRGTTALDGSLLHEHVDSSGFWAALVIVVVGGALLGLHTVVARRRPSIGLPRSSDSLA